MNKIIKFIKHFYANLELKWRISIAIIFLFAITSSAQIIRFWVFIKDDKTVYLIENRNLQTETAASTLSVALQSLGQAIAADATNVYNGYPKLTDAERMPEDTEVFLQTEKSKRKTVFVRSKDGEIRAKSIDIVWLLRQFPVFTEIKGVLLTQSAIPIAYFGMKESETKKAALKRYEQLLLTKTNHGETVRFKFFSDDLLMGHQAVAGTNLMLYTEANLTQLLKPAYDNLRTEALTSAIALILILLIIAFLFKALTAPIQNLVDVFQIIGSGVRSPQWPSLLPEFKPIRLAVGLMNEAISQRQSEIELISSALQDILHISQVSKMVEKLKPFERYSSAGSDIFSVILSPLNDFLAKYFGRFAEKNTVHILMKTYRGQRHHLDAHRLFLPKGFSRLDSSQTESLFETLKIFQSQEGKFFLTDEAGQGFVVKAGSEHWRMEMLLFFPLSLNDVTALERHILELLGNTINNLFEDAHLEQVYLEVNMAQAELASARDIQRSSLVEPVTELTSNISIQTIYEPCEQVGGDWYGIFALPSLNRLNVYIGDVSGHGLTSAFLASLISGAVQSEEMNMRNVTEQINMGKKFRQLAIQLNSIIASGSGEKKHMTMCMSSLNTDTGVVTLLSAGHPFPMKFCKEDNQISPILMVQNNLLGSADDKNFQSVDVRLSPGDMLLFYTDGLIESQSNQTGKVPGLSTESKLGTKKLVKLMDSIGYSSDLAKNLAENVRTHRVVNDDLALVSVIWRGPLNR